MNAARVAPRLAAGAIAAAVLLSGDARPAAADNCSGLSDCYFVSKSAVTVTVGLGTVAIVLLLTPPVGGSPDVKPFDPDDLRKVKTKPGAGPPEPKTEDLADPVKVEQVAKVERTVKVARGDGTVVERPAKVERTPAEEVVVRTKVREAEQAVAKLPRPRKRVIFEEEAAATGQQEKFKALVESIKTGAPPEQLVRAVNPTGDRSNAAATVNAVDATLDKVPRIAKSGGALSVDALASVHDTVGATVTDFGEVHAFLAKAGPGARGVVAVQVELPPSWANAAPVRVGHAFNAVNLDGRIAFLDGQTGMVVESPQEILAAAGYDPATVTELRFVPTHPPAHATGGS